YFTLCPFVNCSPFSVLCCSLLFSVFPISHFEVRNLIPVMRVAFAVLCLLSSVLSSLLVAAEPPITEAELVRRTQELYDSIVSGNQTPWKKYFADDCTFSDEKGRTLDKTKLVADITPLPKGYSGAIKIE